MTNLAQHRRWSLRIQAGVATGVLALVVLGQVVVATPSAQAQADATFTLLYSFKGGTDGQYPSAGLVRDAAGNFYGTTPKVAVPTRERCSSWIRRVRKSYCTVSPECRTGHFPPQVWSGMRLVTSTTQRSSAALPTALERGFRGGTADGAAPYSRLVRDTAGNLYGTTSFGGFRLWNGVQARPLIEIARRDGNT
jgi:hypothetical protein